MADGNDTVEFGLNSTVDLGGNSSGSVDADPNPFLAVIGMAGRFPGAADVAEFWANLRAGRESLTVLATGEAAGGAGRVAAHGVLADADRFDAAFFGYSPGEALLIDPQHRVLLECAYHALEDAGCDPDSYPGAIGIFAGGSTTTYDRALSAAHNQLGALDPWRMRLATAPDFLVTRVAHKLRLRGPAVNVQTACSTSLVAIHLAAQALLSGDCDIALAGGASVHVPPPVNPYTEGGIVSPDGYCRPFDAAGGGTVSGSAVALVVLKPLADAVRDGDRIHAVLRGSAINNDGGDKVGFTAPSIDGQARAIRFAQLIADVDPRSVTYVEAHGTGTELGDPIEVAALTKAFRAGTTERGFCALGSVKANIGHVDAAAGVTGFIKATLAVAHGELPPNPNFRNPNPHIDFAASPFVVNTALQSWPSDGHPRRAGVSSLGLGGTNAHAILEQPPPPTPTGPARPHQLLILSARSTIALEAMTGRLADHLTQRPDTPIADTAWTLQTGRSAHPHRRFLVSGSTEDAAAVLAGADPERLVTGDGQPRPRPVIFLFPGQGGQHVGMARQLYDHEPVFRRSLDECAELVAPTLGLDLRDVLFPPADETESETALATIAVSQPALFAVEHALAELWRHWGVKPAGVVGHSLGAYAAAHTAGVFSLEDALRLVVARGQLLRRVPAGAMAAVLLPCERVETLLSAGLSIAAVNGPEQCAVSGPAPLVEAFIAKLRAREIEVKLLRIATAGHSALVEPIMAEFGEEIRRARPQRPRVPLVSDRTGDWVDEAVTDPRFWSAHLRETVRFDRVLNTVLTNPEHVFVEVGIGHTLSTLTRRHPDYTADHLVAHSLPHPGQRGSDLVAMLTAAGRLWTAGQPIRWPHLQAGQRRTRVTLPAYPFARDRFLAEPAVSAATVSVTSTAMPSPAPHLEPVIAAAEEAERSSPPTLARLAELFAKSLGLATVNPHATFFDLGGDSLIAVRLAGSLRAEFDIPLAPREILAAPTVARLSNLVADRVSAQSEARTAAGDCPVDVDESETVDVR